MTCLSVPIVNILYNDWKTLDFFMYTLYEGEKLILKATPLIYKVCKRTQNWNL